MRAAVCRELGAPSVLGIEELEDPVASAGHVIVKVESAGVNYVDALFIGGKYQIKPPLPFTPGSEVGGTVVSVGPGVEALSVGARVLASIGLGGYASVISVAASNVRSIPPNMTATQASTFTQSYCTALFALRHRARLVAGERVLALGAGGGVGLATVDVARWLGAQVLAAASSPEKRAAALTLGAETAFDSSSPEFHIRSLTGGQGVDVVVDPIGGELSTAGLRGLREGGRLVVIGFASGAIGQLPANQILLRNREVIGVDWGAWALSHSLEQDALLGELLEAVAGGRLQPIEPTTFPLEEAALALEALLERRVTGKVALVP